MSDHPASQSPTPPEPAVELLEAFSQRWQIEIHDGAWIAVRKSGTAMRIIAGHSARELSAKLRAAEAEPTG